MNDTHDINPDFIIGRIELDTYDGLLRENQSLRQEIELLSMALHTAESALEQMKSKK